jgi:hypothetical protein
VTGLAQYTVVQICAGANHSLAVDEWGSLFRDKVPARILLRLAIFQQFPVAVKFRSRDGIRYSGQTVRFFNLVPFVGRVAYQDLINLIGPGKVLQTYDN